MQKREEKLLHITFFVPHVSISLSIKVWGKGGFYCVELAAASRGVPTASVTIHSPESDITTRRESPLTPPYPLTPSPETGSVMLSITCRHILAYLSPGM